jgi:hypothetical protein
MKIPPQAVRGGNMFGQDDTAQSTPAAAPAGDTGALNAALPDPLSVTTTATPPSGFSMPAPSTDPTAAPAPTSDSSAPELPTNSFVTPSTDPTPTAPSEPIIPTSSFPSLDTTTAATADSSDLASIKQQALEHLSPLVSHLDQTPEEKFRTTMMMIQASDNKDLIKDAFAAAQNITDDKARAQALLDVINEINYFTQQETKD